MDDTRVMGTKGNSALVYTRKVRRRDEAAKRLMITRRRKEEDFAVRQRIKPRSPQDNETKMFYEIVIAAGYTPEGLEVLKGKSKNLRILEAKPPRPVFLSTKWRAAGFGRERTP
ncbi:hypothetical protein Vretimale_1738 [Volvox reticuliferus]|uniref:Uncharacterized protein n=1 Tax=Volvox reticuliferus TaxID=1737510 RepID=A0A8J4CUX9_9CHLO|nr:hypothetical protein Vretifemale_15372 [Volvox reticuliferus]GIL95796.1 hypothetical protein Vretimale_1738 [Volvox reticuliferus]